jgi:predicted enzyme related to lactoylglutathione lyase
MGAPVAWFEVTCTDHDRAHKFYAELFGWTINVDPKMGGYGIVDTGAGEDAIGGGIGPSAGPDDPVGVKIYMKVDDLQAYLSRAEQLGGKRVGEPVQLPDNWGTVATFTDPDGNRIGLWQ